MAVKKVTKTTKKVNTAKGKGKVAKKPATKKAAPVAKKKPAVKAVKVVDPNKYGKFYIEDTPTDKYPDLVTITGAPKMYDDFIGRRYVSRSKCITTIDAVRVGDSIEKGAKSVLKEMDAAGIVPLNVESI